MCLWDKSYVPFFSHLSAALFLTIFFPIQQKLEKEYALVLVLYEWTHLIPVLRVYLRQWENNIACFAYGFLIISHYQVTKCTSLISSFSRLAYRWRINFNLSCLVEVIWCVVSRDWKINEGNNLMECCNIITMNTFLFLWKNIFLLYGEQKLLVQIFWAKW